jgi:hypothetical protein
MAPVSMDLDLAKARTHTEAEFPPPYKANLVGQADERVVIQESDRGHQVRFGGKTARIASGSGLGKLTSTYTSEPIPGAICWIISSGGAWDDILRWGVKISG